MKPFIAFIPVQTNVPILERKIFNEKQDLLMLYDLCHGVSTGIIDQVYVLKKLPEISTVGWRTTFIRILRLYVQSESPSEELQILVEFIVKGCLYQSSFASFVIEF